MAQSLILVLVAGTTSDYVCVTLVSWLCDVIRFGITQYHITGMCTSTVPPFTLTNCFVTDVLKKHFQAVLNCTVSDLLDCRVKHPCEILKDSYKIA